MGLGSGPRSELSPGHSLAAFLWHCLPRSLTLSPILSSSSYDTGLVPAKDSNKGKPKSVQCPSSFLISPYPPKSWNRFLLFHSLFVHPMTFNLFILLLPYFVFGVLLECIFSNSLSFLFCTLSYFLSGQYPLNPKLAVICFDLIFITSAPVAGENTARWYFHTCLRISGLLA